MTKIKQTSLEAIGFPNYILYSNGSLYNKRTGHWIKGTTRKQYNKVVQVMLSTNNYNRLFGLANLVATAFLPKTNAEASKVLHKDGNYTNNAVENLEWIDPSEKYTVSWEQIKNYVKGRFESRKTTKNSVVFSYKKSTFSFLKNGDITVNDIYLGNFSNTEMLNIAKTME